jgi:hypothetical protein
MRPPWIVGREALRERLLRDSQVAPTDPEAELPPYLESFLAHVRLLVGVPFEYLVADARLFPDESIRFFHLDRSWTDRLVDGVLAVGKVGSREQAHHQAQDESVRTRIDRTERAVRVLQRRLRPFAEARATAAEDPRAADSVTGFLLRSAVVSGWPHMDVRAFVRTSPPGEQPPRHQALPTLRLERLAPTVLLALFEGVPDLVFLEEPHHGVQFALRTPGGPAFAAPAVDGGGFTVPVRGADGTLLLGADPVAAPVRAANQRVIAVAALRRRLRARQQADPRLPAQTGSAALAVELLSPPWRQRFEGTGPQMGGRAAGFVAPLRVAARAADEDVREAVEDLVG